MTSTASAQQDVAGGIVQVHAWFYECVEPGKHDKFYHVYLAELVGGEARVALHWGKNRTNGQSNNKHHKTMTTALRQVERVRDERDDHKYTLLSAGPIEADAKVISLLGLTGVSAAAAATNPFERHLALSQRCLRLVTGDVSSEHLQVMRELRQLVAELDEAVEELHSRQAMVESRFQQVVMGG